MATKTTVTLIDDVDGGEATESVTFALDGVEYEIDLNDDNADALRVAFSMYVSRGRRTGGRQKPVRPVSNGAGLRPAKQANGSAKSNPSTMTRSELPPQRAPITAADRHAIQRWARDNGFKAPGDRGRIATVVQEGWEEAGRPM